MDGGGAGAAGTAGAVGAGGTTADAAPEEASPLGAESITMSTSMPLARGGERGSEDDNGSERRRRPSTA